VSLPRYPKYKDSEVEWLGEVPEHWDVKSLRRLNCLVQAGPFGSQLHADEYVLGGTPLVNPTNMINGRIVPSEDVTVRADVVERLRHQVLRTGDIVFSRRGELGRCALVGPTEAGWLCGTGSMIVRLEDVAADPGYLSSYLSLGVVRQYFESFSVGAVMDSLSSSTLLALSPVLPPLPEQAAIATFLDRETARVDALVAEQERLVELLREKRQAVISHAVTKGLNPKVPMKDSGVEWLGEIPAHWEVVSARRLFRVRSEPARDGDQQLTASQKYGMIFQSDFVELEGRRVVEVIKGRESLLHVEPNDFVISMRSFQGGLEWCRVRGSTSFHYVMVTPVKHVHPPFFALLLKSSAYIQALRTTTDLIRDGQELRYSNFVRVDLPVIPLDEQAQIAEAIVPELSKIDALSIDAQKAIDLLQERRTALIAAAVTGQIDVRKASGKAA
jgi:type I restriction enzyme S subunit